MTEKIPEEKKQKQPIEKALWYRDDLRTGPLDQDQIAFLQACMEQNLEHARHVENERLTFNSIFMALVAGVLAFVYSIESRFEFFAVMVTLLLMIVGFIAMQLTRRWDNTFDRHIHFAKGCYRLIHEHMFPPLEGWEGTLDENERLEGLAELPAYCFRPKHPDPALKKMKDERAKRAAQNLQSLEPLVINAEVAAAAAGAVDGNAEETGAHGEKKDKKKRMSLDERISHIRTRSLFSAFYWLIEAVLAASLIFFIIKAFI